MDPITIIIIAVVAGLVVMGGIAFAAFKIYKHWPEERSASQRFDTEDEEKLSAEEVINDNYKAFCRILIAKLSKYISEKFREDSFNEDSPSVRNVIDPTIEIPEQEIIKELLHEQEDDSLKKHLQQTDADGRVKVDKNYHAEATINVKVTSNKTNVSQQVPVDININFFAGQTLPAMAAEMDPLLNISENATKRIKCTLNNMARI